MLDTEKIVAKENILSVAFKVFTFNPLMPGGNKKITHT